MKKIIKDNSGAVSLPSIMILIAFLMILFMGMDYMYIVNQKTNTQRKLDAIVLSIVNEGMPSEDVVVNYQGFIVENGVLTNKKLCQISQTALNKGLQNFDEYTGDLEYIVTNQSTSEQLAVGVVRVQIQAKAKNLFLKMFMPKNFQIPFMVESYSVCNATPAQTDEDCLGGHSSANTTLTTDESTGELIGNDGVSYSDVSDDLFDSIDLG